MPRILAAILLIACSVPTQAAARLPYRTPPSLSKKPA